MNDRVKGVIVSVANKTQKMFDWYEDIKTKLKPKKVKVRKYTPLTKTGWFILGWLVGFCFCGSILVAGLILVLWT